MPVKWRVSVDDKVSSGDQPADVETDKASIKVLSFDDGKVANLLVNEGETLPVADRDLGR